MSPSFIQVVVEAGTVVVQVFLVAVVLVILAVLPAVV